jgi:hypothetical protein
MLRLKKVEKRVSDAKCCHGLKSPAPLCQASVKHGTA